MVFQNRHPSLPTNNSSYLVLEMLRERCQPGDLADCRSKVACEKMGDKENLASPTRETSARCRAQDELLGWCSSQSSKDRCLQNHLSSVFWQASRSDEHGHCSGRLSRQFVCKPLSYQNHTPNHLASSPIRDRSCGRLLVEAR